MNVKSLGSAAVMALATGLPGLAGAETLIVAHGYQPSHVNYTMGIEPWMACVTERTAGAVTFEHFPGGQISAHTESVNSLQNGIAHVSGVVPGYETAKLPLTNLASLPGMGATATEMNAAHRVMLDNGSPIAEEWKANGMVPLIVMITPGYQILSMTGPLDSMEKLKGLKIRASAGPQTAAVAALGATPVEITAGDMYVALQRGTVDATVLSLTSAPAYKLEELLKSTSTNGALASGLTTWAMDLKTFEALSPEAQKASIDCGRELEAKVGPASDGAVAKIAENFKAAGVETYEFPPEMVAAINEALAPVAADFVKELDARGLPATQTYEIYRSVLDKK